MLWCNCQFGVSPPRISVSYTSGSLNRWMKATLGTDGGSPGSSTVRCVALGSGWKYGENSPKSHERQDWAETRFFQGILCKHVTWRLLKPWCKTEHENVQFGNNSIFPWFWPFSVRNAVSTWATVQGTLGVPLHDTWLQVVNEDFSWKFDTAQTFCRLLWR
jgi:hypothetical protein